MAFSARGAALSTVVIGFGQAVDRVCVTNKLSPTIQIITACCALSRGDHALCLPHGSIAHKPDLTHAVVKITKFVVPCWGHTLSDREVPIRKIAEQFPDAIPIVTTWLSRANGENTPSRIVSRIAGEAFITTTIILSVWTFCGFRQTTTLGATTIKCTFLVVHAPEVISGGAPIGIRVTTARHAAGGIASGAGTHEQGHEDGQNDDLQELEQVTHG